MPSRSRLKEFADYILHQTVSAPRAVLTRRRIGMEDAFADDEAGRGRPPFPGEICRLLTILPPSPPIHLSYFA